jgi:hypothetical protein
MREVVIRIDAGRLPSRDARDDSAPPAGYLAVRELRKKKKIKLVLEFQSRPE